MRIKLACVFVAGLLLFLASFADQDMPGILEIGDLIERNVAGSRKVVFKGAAHMVNVEQPEKFAKIVLEFLRK